MVKTKQAITLAEILIVMAIVGVVSICLLVTYKPNDKATRRLYYNAYKTLSTSAYNVYRKLEYENRQRIENEETPYEPVNVNMRSGFARLGTVLYAEGDTLCKKMAELFNTTSAGCSGSHGYKAPTVNAPDIVASNGMRFYFSTPFIAGNVIHRIVWVDLDGAHKGNNSPIWSQNNLADIVAFDIGDFGDVVPLGYPKIDSRYTQGVLITSRPGANYIGGRTTFYEAQLAAYSGQSYDFDMMSTNIEFTDNKFNESALKVPAETLNKFSAASTDCATDSSIPSCTIDIVP